MQLRQDQYGRQRIDAPEAAQPPDRFAIGRTLSDLCELAIQRHEPRLRVIDGQQIVVDDRPLGGVRPRQTLDP